MPRLRSSRVYWRERDGGRRAYADFRDYADVGGKREALVPDGATRPTDDSDIAATLLAKRLKELDGLRYQATVGGRKSAPALEAYATKHLVLKKKSGRFADRYLGDLERQLTRAVEYFGANRPLDKIDVEDVERWLDHLREHGEGRERSGGTLRHHLNALSNLYRRAQGDKNAHVRHNPAAAVMDKPKGAQKEAKWLEVPDAALLLEAGRTYKPKRADIAVGSIYEIVATSLLTGGRPSEVLNLESADVSFQRKMITFRPHAGRLRLKTEKSFRTVPLHPQLMQILKAYLNPVDRPPSRLLFPSYRLAGNGLDIEEHPPREIRKALDAVAKRAGWKAGEIRPYIFRHTYCAARLQTLDNGAPVSPFTVARELGHGGTRLVERIYGHLGTVRHRSKHVEYRAAQWKKQLGARLTSLGATERVEEGVIPAPIPRRASTNASGAPGRSRGNRLSPGTTPADFGPERKRPATP